MLAQATPSSIAPDASTIFYFTLLVIFLSAIITAVVTKWTRDKCLRFFHRFHVTLERARGQTLWGQLKVFSAGVEVVYDHAFADARGRKKTSYLIYGQELDQHLLSMLRYHDELTDEQKRARDRQIRWLFNPGPLRRFRRHVRNIFNTLKDAFNAAIGTAVTQFQRVSPAGAGAMLATQGSSVTQLSQTLLGKFANAYEPLLEQYIGRPVILDVADPINPNNATVEYVGFLADYTQNFIAVFNVHHSKGDTIEITLPDVASGPVLPPLPNPPPPGAPAPMLPDPLKVEHDIAIRIDGLRMKIQNLGYEAVVLRSLQREGYEPLTMGVIIAPMATFDLPARDARGATLKLDVLRCLDVVAPRRVATVRHAGELVEKRGLVDELHLSQLPLMPTLFSQVRSRESDTSDEID